VLAIELYSEQIRGGSSESSALAQCGRPVRGLLPIGIHYQTPSPCWLQYHPAEASYLLYHVRNHAHFIAAKSTRSLAIIILSRSRSGYIGNL